MSDKSDKHTHMHPALKKVLIFILIMTGSIILTSQVWVYNKIHQSFGQELAQVISAFLSILILALVVTGVRAGISMDRLIRQGRVVRWRIYRSFRQVQRFLSLLGYDDFLYEVTKTSTGNLPDHQEVLTILNRAPRRGRPPTYSLDRWKRVVLAWENRDPLRNPLTLADFLSEEFGTYADGSPRMSENSYYDWRKKVFDELRKEADTAQVQT